MVLLRTRNWAVSTFRHHYTWAHVDVYQDYYSTQASFSFLGYGLVIEKLGYVKGQYRVKRAWGKAWYK